MLRLSPLITESMNSRFEKPLLQLLLNYLYFRVDLDTVLDLGLYKQAVDRR